MNTGDTLHLSLTLPGRRALARIAELEALILEEQQTRAEYGDELARLRSSTGEPADEVWRAAIVDVINVRVALKSDPYGAADDVIALVRAEP